MSRLTSTVACAAVWLTVVLVRVDASLAPRGRQDPTPASTKSTMTGVYTAEQASAGENTFGNLCTGCHNLGSHSGPSFSLKWKGKSVFDLYEVISEKMPEDDPGSLSPKESAELVAYLLKVNGSPAGKEALPTDADALKKILIETK